MPRRRQPGPPTVEITAENRAAQLAAARAAQPKRPPAHVDFWRRYVKQHWRGTALDDEDALLVASSGPTALLTAVPALRTYLQQLCAIDFPASELVRAALAREEVLEPKFFLEVLAEADEVRRRLERLRLLADVLLHQGVQPIATYVAPSFRSARAETVDRLLRFLTARHPERRTPPWKIVAAFLWYAGSWRVNPANEKSVDAMRADWHDWRQATFL
jgi:hypothetical protein